MVSPFSLYLKHYKEFSEGRTLSAAKFVEFLYEMGYTFSSNYHYKCKVNEKGKMVINDSEFSGAVTLLDMYIELVRLSEYSEDFTKEDIDRAFIFSCVTCKIGDSDMEPGIGHYYDMFIGGSVGCARLKLAGCSDDEYYKASSSRYAKEK